MHAYYERISASQLVPPNDYIPEEVRSCHKDVTVAYPLSPLIDIVVAVEQVGKVCQQDPSCFEIDPMRDELESCQSGNLAFG